MKPDQKRISQYLFWDHELHLVQGCTKCAPECKNCWECHRVHPRMLGNPRTRHRVEGTIQKVGDQWEWTDQIREIWGDLKKPERMKKGKVWSVWTDLFHPKVSSLFQYHVILRMENCQQHAFIVCTKRPRNAFLFFSRFKENREVIEYYDLECTGWLPRRYFTKRSEWPLKNFIFMVTAGTVKSVKEKVSFLKEIPAAVKGVIAEPLLEDISPELEKYMKDIDWLIFGGENGAREKVRAINYVDANNLLKLGLKHEKKIFFKGWGRFIPPGQEPGKIDGVAWRQFPDM